MATQKLGHCVKLMQSGCCLGTVSEMEHDHCSRVEIWALEDKQGVWKFDFSIFQVLKIPERCHDDAM